MASSSTIPNFLVAESPEALRSLMLENNALLNAFVNYRWIQHVNNKWYAWYDVDVEKEMIIQANKVKKENEEK